MEIVEQGTANYETRLLSFFLRYILHSHSRRSLYRNSRLRDSQLKINGRDRIRGRLAALLVHDERSCTMN